MGSHSIGRTRLTAFVVTCLCSLMLAACGGGGGGESSPSSDAGPNPSQNPNPNPDPNQTPDPRPGEFTLTSTSVAITAKIGAFAPVATVGVQLNDTVPAAVVAGYAAGVTPANWLDIHKVGSGPNVTFALVAIPSAQMQPGIYRTTIAIATVDSEGDQLVTKVVPVTLTLREGVLAYGSGAMIDATFGSSVHEFTHLVGVSAPSSISWQATADVPWLTFTSSIQGQGRGRSTRP